MRRKNRSNGKIVQFGGRQVELWGEEKKRKEKRRRKIENNDASFDGVYTIRVYGFELGIYIYIYGRASDQKVRRVLHSLKPASTALSDLSYRNEGFRSATPRCYSSRLIRGNAPE